MARMLNLSLNEVCMSQEQAQETRITTNLIPITPSHTRFLSQLPIYVSYYIFAPTKESSFLVTLNESLPTNKIMYFI